MDFHVYRNKKKKKSVFVCVYAEGCPTGKKKNS